MQQKSYQQKAYLSKYPYHLIQSGNIAKYCQTLMDFKFIQDKIDYPDLGVQALIEDYDLIDDAKITNNPEYNPDKVKSLKYIQGALRLAAHILSEDKTQLVGQLWGRLRGFDKFDDIQSLLQQAKQQITAPWLCPLTLSLTPPGGRLIRPLVWS